MVISCKNTENKKSQPMAISEIVTTQLGEKFERKDRGEFALCYSLNKTSSKGKTIIVVNMTTGKVIYGPEKLNADVEWSSDTQLLIKEYPEVIQDKNSSETYAYYYDIIEQKKVSEKL